MKITKKQLQQLQQAKRFNIFPTSEVIQHFPNKRSDSTILTCQHLLAIDPGYGRCGWAILAKGEKIQNSKCRIQNKIPTYAKATVDRQNLKSNKSAICNRQSEIQLLACDCIETDKKNELPDRLSEIYQAIEYLIKKYQPNELAIESLFWFKNKKTAMAVAQARGVIIVAAKNHKLDISEYTPLQVKQAVVGYGKATKDQIQKMIKLHLPNQHTPIQDDAADAIAIGLTHFQTRKYLKR